MKRNNPLLVLGAWLGLFLPAAHAADGPAGSAPLGAGVIAGQVISPATGEFLANAQVRVQGTDVSAVTSIDGRYRIANVPAGVSIVAAVVFTKIGPAI